jgi:hypothetical protein
LAPTAAAASFLETLLVPGRMTWSDGAGRKVGENTTALPILCGDRGPVVKESLNDFGPVAPVNTHRAFQDTVLHERPSRTVDNGIPTLVPSSRAFCTMRRQTPVRHASSKLYRVWGLSAWVFVRSACLVSTTSDTRFHLQF